MSERISPPPFSHMVTGSSDAPVVGIPATARGRRFSPASSLTALLLLGAFGCSSAGSSFEGTGGSGQPPGSGGGGVATGGALEEDRAQAERELDFFDLKGALEAAVADRATELTRIMPFWLKSWSRRP